MKSMIRAGVVVAMIAGLPATGWTNPDVAAGAEGRPLVDAHKKWFNAIEFNCRSQPTKPGAKPETYEQFQARVNQRLLVLGAEGWELVSVANAPLQGNDCLAFGLRKPATE